MGWKYTGISKKGFKSFFYDVFPALEPGYWYGNYDEEKYEQYRFWHQLPGFRQLIDANIDDYRDQLYFDNHDMDYDDIKDPRNMPSGQTNGATSAAQFALNFVSSNLNKLYKDNTKQRISDAYDRGFRNANTYWKGYYNAYNRRR